MYGSNTAGMFGYSHFTGGFAGGQAEWVRVPYGDVNLLKLPPSVPDEKGQCCATQCLLLCLTLCQDFICPMSSLPHGIAWSTPVSRRAT